MTPRLGTQTTEEVQCRTMILYAAGNLPKSDKSFSTFLKLQVSACSDPILPSAVIDDDVRPRLSALHPFDC